MNDDDNGGSFGHHGCYALGLAVVVGLIAFAFGPRTARAVVAVGLLAGAAAFLYVFARVVMGTV